MPPITSSMMSDWLYNKLHTHCMAPDATDTILGVPVQNFQKELIDGASERREIPHFVSAREMANIVLAACYGREGNPGAYRDYRYKLGRAPISKATPETAGLALRT